jgi:hypothetical protein
MAKQNYEELLPLKFSVNYHYAHAIQYGQKISGIQIINFKEGTIEIQETLIETTPNILVKFSFNGIETLFNDKTKDNVSLEIDIYSGTVAIKYTIPRSVPKPNVSLQWIKVNNDPYIYQANIGYSEEIKDIIYGGNTQAGFSPQYRMINNYKPADDFGYILESPPRIAVLFMKGFGCVENLQKGIVKLKTSSFDVNGYIVQLFSEAILKITKLLDDINSPLLEKNVQLKEVKEESEETRLELSNFNLNELTDEPINLLGKNE